MHHRGRSRRTTVQRLLVAGILPTFLAAGACSRRPASAPPRHVLLLVIDTQRADHLSGYGYPRPTSPALDALAKEGVLFEKVASQASWTLPSMVSMMTSCYVAEEIFRIPDGKKTLAEVFKEHGWTTGAFICNDLICPENRFDSGFDTFEWELKPYGPNVPILDWLRAHKDQRTFTYVHLNEVHDDTPKEEPGKEKDWRYAPADKVKSRFQAEDLALSPERLRFYDDVSEKLHLVGKEKDIPRIKAGIGGYDDDVAYSDARIREILDEYRKLGLWDSTAVVIAADHGEGLWTRVQYLEGTRKTARDNGMQSTLWNTLLVTHGSQTAIELVHVPLILKAPGLRAGTKVGAWVENVDIFPTLLELCGLPQPETALGKSLLPLAADPRSQDGVKEAVFSHTRFQSSVITQDGVQLLHPTPRGECDFGLIDELYDLRVDPEARKNLAAARREIVQKLTKIAAQHVKTGLQSVQAKPSAALVKSLQGLGYIDSGVVDAMNEQLEAMSTKDLIAGVASSMDCLVRLQMVRALRGRVLAGEDKAAVEKILEKETSTAVREGLEALLPR